MAYVVIALSFVRGLYLGLERSGRIPTALFKIFWECRDGATR